MSSRKVGAPSVGRWSCSRGQAVAWLARLWESAEEPKPPLPSGINGEGCTCLGYDCLVGSVTRSTERGCPRSSEAPQEGLQGWALETYTLQESCATRSLVAKKAMFEVRARSLPSRLAMKDRMRTQCATFRPNNAVFSGETRAAILLIL